MEDAYPLFWVLHGKPRAFQPGIAHDEAEIARKGRLQPIHRDRNVEIDPRPLGTDLAVDIDSDAARRRIG